MSLLFLPSNIMELILLTMVIASVSSEYDEPIDLYQWFGSNKVQDDKMIPNDYSISKGNDIFKPNVLEKPMGSQKAGSFMGPSITGKPSSFENLNQNAANPSVCNCGSRNSGRIVGGKETLQNEYPWMVLLECGDHICGGTIITPFHVLTAAHCTYRLEPHQITIYVAKHNLENPYEGEQHSITRIIQHKEYKDQVPVSDIALLVTESPITFNRNAGPVCLPHKRFNLEGKALKAIGWGRTDGTGNRNILHELDLGFVPLEECRKKVPHKVLVETQLCALENNKDVCTGDSGGPFVYHNPDNNRYTQVALVSSGGHCKGTVPSINTDVFAFMDWINAGISESKPGVKVCTGN